jgi:hypothetical protein
MSYTAYGNGQEQLRPLQLRLGGGISPLSLMLTHSKKGLRGRPMVFSALLYINPCVVFIEQDLCAHAWKFTAAFFASLKHWHLRNGGARIMSIEKCVHHQREREREKKWLRDKERLHNSSFLKINRNGLQKYLLEKCY